MMIAIITMHFASFSFHLCSFMLVGLKWYMLVDVYSVVLYCLQLCMSFIRVIIHTGSSRCVGFCLELLV